MEWASISMLSAVGLPRRSLGEDGSASVERVQQAGGEIEKNRASALTFSAKMPIQ
jgi:hypothetical protein